MSRPADDTAQMLADLQTLKAAQAQAVGMVVRSGLADMVRRLEAKINERVKEAQR